MISSDIFEKTGKLRDVIDDLHAKCVLSKKKEDDYFEPGKMEYLDQYEGVYRDDNTFMIKFQVMGTQYEGRIDEIEFIKRNQDVFIERDPTNKYNSNNFKIMDNNKNCIGNMPAILCDAIASLYDSENLTIISSKVSFVKPLSQRNRHAKKPIVFVELNGEIENKHQKMETD